MESSLIDSYYQFTQTLTLTHPGFHLFPPNAKEIAFQDTLLQSPIFLPSTDPPTFLYFLGQLALAVNEALVATAKDTEIPLERFLRKFIEFQGFRIESKEVNPDAGLTLAYGITFNFSKRSVCVECLSFLVEAIRNTPGAAEVINQAVDLSVPLVRALRSLLEFEKVYDMSVVEANMNMIKDNIWENLEGVLVEESMACVISSVSRGSLLELFQLDRKKDMTYSVRIREIFKKLAGMAKNHRFYGKLNGFLDENKCLVTMWKDLRFYEERAGLKEKYEFLNYLLDVSTTVTGYEARSIERTILDRILAMLEKDIKETLNNSSDENFKYLAGAIQDIASLSRLPIRIYEAGSQEKSECIIPFHHIKVQQGQITGFTLQNTIFIEKLFEAVVTQKEKTILWHELILETNSMIFTVINQCALNGQILELGLRPFEYLIKTLHTCEKKCLDSSLNVIGLFLTQVEHRDTAKDVYLLSSYLKETEDMQGYMDTVTFIKNLCEGNSPILGFFGKDLTLHEDLVRRLLSYAEKKTEFTVEFVETLCSLIKILVGENKYYLDIIYKKQVVPALLDSSQEDVIKAIFLSEIIEILDVDVKWAKAYNNLYQAFVAFGQRKSTHLEAIIQVLETLITRKIHQDKNCVKGFVKTKAFFGLFTELLTETLFDGIGKEGSEFARVWKILENVIGTSKELTDYYCEKVQGFEKIVGYAAVGDVDVTKKLLELALYEGKIVRFPRFFREIYNVLVFKKGLEGEYVEILRGLLDNEKANYKVLNSVGFLEYLDDMLCTKEVLCELALKFWENSPCNSVLRLFKRFISNGGMKEESLILEKLRQSVEKEKETSRSTLSLSKQKGGPCYNWKGLWVPNLKIFSPVIVSSKEKTKHLITEDSLTIFTQLHLENLAADGNDYTIFMLSDWSENILLKTFINQDSLNILSYDQETVISADFSKVCSTKAFTLAVTLSIPRAQNLPANISVYLNGALETKFTSNIPPTPPQENSYQLVLGPCGERPSPVSGEFSDFMLFERLLTKNEVQDLHIIAAYGVDNSLRLLGDSVEIDIKGQDLLESQLEVNSNIFIPERSEATFEEKIVCKVSWGSLLKDLVVHYSFGLGVKRLKNEERLQEAMIAWLSGCLKRVQEDIHGILMKESFGFVKNMVGEDGNGFLIGCEGENFMKNWKRGVWDENRKSIVEIFEESEIIEILIRRVIEGFAGKNEVGVIKEIMKILVGLYKGSRKIRRALLVENRIMDLVCKGLEKAKTGKEEMEILKISKGLWLESVGQKEEKKEDEGREENPSLVINLRNGRYEEEEKGEVEDLTFEEKGDGEHYVVYSKNAFRGLFGAYDVLNGRNQKVVAEILRVFEENILREENPFYRWNIRMLREVRFGEKLVDGLVMGHYADFREETLRLIAKLVSRSKDQEMGLSCIVKIGRALDFLAFSAEMPQNNFAGMNLNFSIDKSLSSSVAIAEESRVGSISKKYVKLTNQSAQYAQIISKSFLNILLALFIENTFKPLVIENSTMILNILFCYGDHETYIKVVKTLLDYIPRYWEPEIGPAPANQAPAESKEKGKSSKSLWGALTGKNKEEGKKKAEAGYRVPKTKETESFLEDLHRYLKAMVLLVLQKIPVQDSYRVAQFLSVVEMSEATIFDEKNQEMGFMSGLLYLLLPILLNHADMKLRSQVLRVIYYLLSHAKDLGKKLLSHEKINLYDKLFQILLKNKTAVDSLSIAVFQPLLNPKIDDMKTFISSKLLNEWTVFYNEVRINLDFFANSKYHQAFPVVLADNPLYYSSVLHPKLFQPSVGSSADKIKTRTFSLVSFFQKPSSAQNKVDLNNSDLQINPSSRALQPLRERFDVKYIELKQQEQVKGELMTKIEEKMEKYLKQSNKEIFMKTLQDSVDIGTLGSCTYTWHSDSKNYPQGQRLKLKLKEIQTSKKDLERIRSHHEQEDEILILQDKNEEEEKAPEEVAADDDEARMMKLAAFKLKSPVEENEEESLAIIDIVEMNNSSPEKIAAGGSPRSSISDGVSDQDMIERLETQASGVKLDRLSQELKIEEAIEGRYNCLWIERLERAECVFLIGKNSLYICENYQFDEAGELIKVSPINHKTMERAKWITLKGKKTDGLVARKSFMNMSIKNESLASLKDLDEAKAQHKITRIPLENLFEIHAIRYLLQPGALEIYVESGRSYFLAFNPNIRNQILINIINFHAKLYNRKISKLDINIPSKEALLFATLTPEPFTPRKKTYNRPGQPRRFYLSTATNLAKQAQSLWIEGQISNYDYLAMLNMVSGRTYSDLSQYPVYPWTVQDYQDLKLKYKKKEAYRKFMAPIGVQTAERVEKVGKRYAETKTMESAAYHYGSHYSSPGTIMYYLIRVFPFSEYIANLQGGKFDFPDRLFRSVESTFNLAQKLDFKELSPEFYTLPEFLINLNQFNFGKTQEGSSVSNVELAKWASENPRQFTQSMRRALEGETPSKGLNEWIDLIFGDIQSGKKAEKAMNLYYAFTYEGAVNLEIMDPAELEVLLLQISEFGQCPKKLFHKAHPQRKRMGGNTALFGSKDRLKDLSMNLIKQGKIGNIKDLRIRGDMVDDSRNNIGLGSFQQVINYTEEIEESLMYGSEGFILRGEKKWQVLNWKNLYKSLVLFSAEKEGNVIKVFMDEEFEDLAVVHGTKEGDVLVLGSNSGRLAVLLVREDVVEGKENEGEVLKKKKSLFPDIFTKSSSNVEEKEKDLLSKVTSEVQAEGVIEGWDIHKEKVRERVLRSLGDKEVYGLEDFRDNEEEKQQQGKGKIKEKVFGKEEEMGLINKYSQIPRANIEEVKERELRLIKEAVVPEAHESRVSVIETCRQWDMMVTGDEKGIVKLWELKKARVMQEIFTYHFVDVEMYKESVYKGEEEVFTKILKRGAQREKIRGVSISEANGDFCVVSSHYVSVYTINGVLLSILNTKEAGVPPIRTALLVKNKSVYEENYLITGHKDGVIWFWTFKESEAWKSAVNRDELLIGKFGHLYERSLYVNRAIKLNDTVMGSRMGINPAVGQGRTLKIVSMSLSYDQTKLLVALNVGDILCLKIKEESGGSQFKGSCTWCNAQLGLIDTRVSCGICNRICCEDCTTTEEIVNFLNLWKKMKICPECTMKMNEALENTLYDNY